MTKEVLLTITGLQFDGESEQKYSDTFPGEYYERGGKRYVVYDEVMEGFTESTKNIIKFTEKEVDVTRKGVVNTQMLFEENKLNRTSYRTPYGELVMGINTVGIRFLETEERIRVDVEYELELNYEHQADCKISIDIRPRV